MRLGFSHSSWRAIVLCLGLGLALGARAAEVYSTWGDTMEVDKVATAWLVLRHVDPDATIRFYPKGTFKMEGTTFDMPTADLKPTRQQATFEKVIEKHKLDEPALAAMARVIHDIEINKWDEKATAEAKGIEAVIRGLELAYPERDECLRHCLVVFDGLYRAFNEKVAGR